MKKVTSRPGEIVIEAGNSVIICYALGSSLGICLYDAAKQMGGFVNSLLPICQGNDDGDIKYVNNAIRILYQQMIAQGSHHEDITAKIVGGAQLFDLHHQDVERNIGKENIKSAYQTLMSLHIPIIGEDVGDTYGRTVYFNIENGSVYIETRNKNIYHL